MDKEIEVLDLYKLYSLATDRKGTVYHLFDSFLQQSYKTLQRKEKKLLEFELDIDYLNEYGKLSDENYSQLNNLLANFFKKTTAEDFLLGRKIFPKEFKLVHPDFYTHLLFLCSCKLSLEENKDNGQLYSFFMKGYDYSLNQMIVFSRIRYALAKRNKEEYYKLAKNLKIPFEMPHQEIWEEKRTLDQEKKCKTFEIECLVFIILYADILLFSSELGESRLIFWLKKTIEEKKTAREICFTNLRKNAFKSSEYEKFVQDAKMCCVGSSKSFYDFLHSYYEKKEVETLERYCKKFRSQEKLSDKGLEHILRLYLMAVERQVDKKYFADIKSEFAFACFIDELYRKMKPIESVYNAMLEFQDWLKKDVYEIR